jgi:cytochrome c
MYKNVDLTGIGKLELSIASMAQHAGGEIEVHLDSPTGELLGKTNFKNGTRVKINDRVTAVLSKITLAKPVRNRHNLYLLFTNEKAGDKDLFLFSQINLEK